MSLTHVDISGTSALHRYVISSLPGNFMQQLPFWFDEPKQDFHGDDAIVMKTKAVVAFLINSFILKVTLGSMRYSHSSFLHQPLLDVFDTYYQINLPIGIAILLSFLS